MDCAPEWAPGRESSLRSAGWASKGSGEALHLAVGRHVRARKLPLELVWIKNHPDDGSTSVYCSTDEKCRLAVGDDGPEPVFQVLIRPSTSDRSGMSRSHSEIKIISFLPEHILPVAFNARPGRFLIEAELPNQKYDVVINTAGRKDLLAPMMQQAVSAALGIEAVWENRMVDAYVLRKSPETKLEPLPAVQGSYSRASKGELEASNVDGLALMVASRLDRPVLDETRLHGSYRIKLQFDPEDHSSIAHAIKSTLGLELVQARRQVRMLIVRNSGNSRKIEPWIHLSVAVLLALVPLYLKRRWNR